MIKVLLGLLFITFSSHAYEGQTNIPKQSHEAIPQLQNMEVKENPGTFLTLSRKFTNEAGQVVPLGTYFDGRRPVLLTMIYYGCPSLCNYHLNGITETLKKMDGKIGEDYQVVAVSMNHSETHTLAGKKKASYVEALGQVGGNDGMHFLVGTEENVKALANELGFPFRWVEEEQQYAHPAVAHIMSPDGMISRYLHGIAFDEKTLRLSLVEASRGEIGSIIEQLTLFCFQFNPSKNKYTFFAYNIMRAGAGLTVVLLAVFLIPLWRRERQRNLRIAKGEA